MCNAFVDMPIWGGGDWLITSLIYYNTPKFESSKIFINEGLKVNFKPLSQPYFGNLRMYILRKTNVMVYELLFLLCKMML